ncbi:MAG: hypothetical protein KC944_12345 [Candidatus Omnitrophica bacterium]|nr:hypothetical protein [Candidatus Omnitrophota bacterium]
MEDRLVQVRLREGKKPQRFLLPDEFDVEVGNWVVVQDEEDEDLGTVTAKPIPLPLEWEDVELPEVVGVPDVEEVEKTVQVRTEREPDAIKIAYGKVREREMDIKLVQARYYQRSNKMKFHFTSENRVDFRELVKDLAHEFHARIEMRQIGVRDAAGIAGGYGLCGQELCCSRFLKGFDPITIRMAKDQYLALNPSKISGCCGRLLCCLKYEHETYVDAKKRFPKLGASTRYEEKQGKVTGVNIIKETVTLLAESNIFEISLEEFKQNHPAWRGPAKASQPGPSPTQPDDSETETEEEVLIEGAETEKVQGSLTELEEKDKSEVASGRSESSGKSRRRRRRRRKPKQSNE